MLWLQLEGILLQDPQRKVTWIDFTVSVLKRWDTRKGIFIIKATELHEATGFQSGWNIHEKQAPANESKH